MDNGHQLVTGYTHLGDQVSIGLVAPGVPSPVHGAGAVAAARLRRVASLARVEGVHRDGGLGLLADAGQPGPRLRRVPRVRVAQRPADSTELSRRPGERRVQEDYLESILLYLHTRCL